MANSRVGLKCKHCGKSFTLGKGYMGSYCLSNEFDLEKFGYMLDEFFEVHSEGKCVESGDISNCFTDNCTDHFEITEEK